MTADFSNGMHHQDRISAWTLHVETEVKRRVEAGTDAEEIAERTTDLRMRRTVKGDRQEQPSATPRSALVLLALQISAKRT